MFAEKPNTTSSQLIFLHLGELEQYKVTSIFPVAEDYFRTIQRHPESVTMAQNIMFYKEKEGKKQKSGQMNK